MIASKVHVKQGALRDDDICDLWRSIQNLDYLWNSAGLSFTPKIHGMLAHATDQIECLGGNGHMLEDDLGHMHQVSQKISHRTSRIKNFTQQALSHSKIESRLQKQEIIEKTMES